MAALVPTISGGIVQPVCNRPAVTWANDATFGFVVRRLVTFSPEPNGYPLETQV